VSNSKALIFLKINIYIGAILCGTPTLPMHSFRIDTTKKNGKMTQCIFYQSPSGIWIKKYVKYPKAVDGTPGIKVEFDPRDSDRARTLIHLMQLEERLQQTINYKAYLHATRKKVPKTSEQKNDGKKS